MPGQSSKRSDSLTITNKTSDELTQTYAYIAVQNRYAHARKKIDDEILEIQQDAQQERQAIQGSNKKEGTKNQEINRINLLQKELINQCVQQKQGMLEADKINTKAQLNSATGLCELWGDRHTQEDAADARVLSESALTWELLGKELREKALVNTVSTLESILEQEKQDQVRGSTLCASVIGFGKITTANVGDSAAILVYWDDKGKVQFKRMGHSHGIEDINADQEEDFYKTEWERIQDFVCETDDGALRLPNRINLSRSMGDNQFYPGYNGNFATSHEAEITETDIPVSQHAFLVTACDGLTDAFTDQGIADFVQGYVTNNPNASTQDISTALAKAAYDKGSEDNITVLVSDVNQIQKSGQLHSVSVFDGHGAGGGHEPAQTLREQFSPVLKKNIEETILNLEVELGLKQSKKTENKTSQDKKFENKKTDPILISDDDESNSEEEIILGTEDKKPSDKQPTNSIFIENDNNESEANSISNTKEPKQNQNQNQNQTNEESLLETDTSSENVDLLGKAGNFFLKEIENIVQSKEFEISDLPILTECIQNVKALIQSIRAMSQEDEKTPLKTVKNAQKPKDGNTQSSKTTSGKTQAQGNAEKPKSVNDAFKACFDSIQKIQKLNRTWSKRLAQVALVVAGFCLIALAITVAVATLGGATPLAVLAIPVAGALLKSVAVGAVMAAGAVSASGMGMFAIKMASQKPPIQETMETVNRKARDFAKSQLPKK